jgi:RND family efflux transporter MFP subunit
MSGLKLNKRAIVVIFLSFMILLSACGMGENTVDGGPQETPLKKVKIAPLQTAQLGEAIMVDAEVSPKVQVSIITEIGGTVKAQYSNVGDSIAKGDVLLELETTDLSLSLQRAQIAKEKVLLKMDSMKEQLRSSNTEENSQLEQMKLSLKETELAIQEVHRQLAKASIQSPIDGVIVESADLTAGQMLSAGQQVVSIQQLNKLYAQANVTEQDALDIEHKKQLNVHIPVLNQTFLANIDYLSPSASESGQFSVRVTLDNENLTIRPGMSAHLILNDALAQEVLSVPIASVFEEDGKAYVFVYKADKVSKTEIIIGRKNKSVVEVINGLLAEDQIVIAGQSQLQDGDEVEVAAP